MQMVLMQVVKSNCFIFPGSVPETPGARSVTLALEKQEVGAGRRSAAPPEMFVRCVTIRPQTVLGGRHGDHASLQPGPPRGRWTLGRGLPQRCRVSKSARGSWGCSGTQGARAALRESPHQEK